VKRHQTAVTASAAAVLVAVVSLTVAAVLLTQANGLLRQAKEEEAQAKELALRREREAIEQRDLALANLREAEEQRNRSHFYLETMFNMKRFGRSLKAHPLRNDFELRIHLVNGSRGERQRGEIARGDFDREQPFYLSIESTADCHLHIFYAVPADARDRMDSRVRTSLDPILAVFPNRVEHDNRIVRSTRRLLLNNPRLFLSPLLTSGEVAYLYVLATQKDWKFEPDRDHDGGHNSFPSFSPKAAARLAEQISQIVEGTGSSAAGDRGKIAEEIVIFNVRSEANEPGR
jgi:hypothetical protein